ncbi:response regulator [Hyphomonas sp.]|uniref:response regulator n=1 Tax=Hyphomonas sp. TaxID=87 RepID=UPI003919A52E
MSIKDSLRILVVDDMAASRGVLINGLEQCGIKNIFSETSCDGALSFMLKTPVHLVVSDYNMPGKSGLDLLKSIRASGQLQRTGFILVSGTTDSSVVTEGQRLGMNNFLPKPVTPESLRKTVEAVVGRL